MRSEVGHSHFGGNTDFEPESVIHHAEHNSGRCKRKPRLRRS
jgi:hypothetical protein